MIIIIFKYNSNMVMICVVEYPVKKNNIPSRRMKKILLDEQEFSAHIPTMCYIYSLPFSFLPSLFLKNINDNIDDT